MGNEMSWHVWLTFEEGRASLGGHSNHRYQGEIVIVGRSLDPFSHNALLPSYRKYCLFVCLLFFCK
jgi:hypothetical protein